MLNVNSFKFNSPNIELTAFSPELLMQKFGIIFTAA